jgi:hypothetical protein
LKTRRRARQRGILPIELLVITPLFTLLMGTAYWFYEIHTKQMSVMRRAREPVWATATFACGNPGETSASYPGVQPGVSVGGGPIVYVPGADYTQIYKNVPGGPNNEVLTRATADAEIDVTDDLAGNDFLHLRETHYAAHARMMCNDTVHDGQPNTMKRIAAGAFQP